MRDRDLPLKNTRSRRKAPREKPAPKMPALTTAQKRELTGYFEDRVARLDIVETTKTPSGQILDWIDIYSQHPKRKIATPPPAPKIPTKRQRSRPTKKAHFELQEKGSKRGPDGTVPVLRTDPKKLHFNKTLEEFLSKHGHRTVTRYYDGYALEQPEIGGPHDYGATAESVNCQGGGRLHQSV